MYLRVIFYLSRLEIDFQGFHYWLTLIVTLAYCLQKVMKMESLQSLFLTQSKMKSLIFDFSLVWLAFFSS